MIAVLILALVLRPVLSQLYYGFDGVGNNVAHPEWG